MEDWIKLEDQIPTVEKHGESVLIYRILNESQKALSISVHSTNMLKHSNKKETWWMPLPNVPKEATNN